MKLSNCGLFRRKRRSYLLGNTVFQDLKVCKKALHLLFFGAVVGSPDAFILVYQDKIFRVDHIKRPPVSVGLTAR